MEKQTIQKVKVETMITVKSPNQLYIFDPWDFLSPKRRQMLDAGWPGLFRQHILPTLPVDKIIKHFDSQVGRPSKELYAMLGALVLQQTFDLTDEDTVQQFSFNIQWHYALNITEDSDTAKYLSPKTLWNNRNTVACNNLEDIIFDNATKQLATAFNVDTEKQRIDSVHIKSNMRRLGRIGIFSECIHKFLVNLKRQHQDQFNSVNQKIVDTYLSKEALGCFSRVKPSESRKTLSQVSKDLFELVEQFKAMKPVVSMHSYKLLVRVLSEQCNLTEDAHSPVELKAPKQIVSDSLQNPSDPDATYSGHKGQGYQVQIMETYCDDPQQKPDSVNLITHVALEQAHRSDANALVPAIEAAKQRDLKPAQLTADALYGSDDNVESARQQDVELIAPAMGAVKQDKLSLADFQWTEQAQVLACPCGHEPARVKKRKTISAGFDAQHCQSCPDLPICPVKKGSKHYFIHFNAKQARIAVRRQYERSDSFTEQYRWRAGVEATMSEYDRRTGVKRLRVRGMKAVRLCAVLKALAINIFRTAAARAARMVPDPAPCML